MRISRATRTAVVGAAMMIVLTASATLASSHTPSTNADNKEAGWAYVTVTAEPGSATLTFTSTRNFYSCFEYRTDGDESQQTAENNPNPAVEDGLYPYVCVRNESITVTVDADEYVEVRMVFGAESDERFDWTIFEVPSDDACKNGGWEDFGFANQGACMQFAQTGKDSR